MNRTSPPAQAKNDISLTGVTEGYLLGLGREPPGKRRGIPGKPARKRGREDVDVVGPSEMQKVPDHLDAVHLRGTHDGEDRREIVFAPRARSTDPRSPVATSR